MECSKFGGQWNVLILVANGILQAWWPMECSNGWWPMECSIVWWPMEGEGNTIFHLFSFSPQFFLLKPSIFPLILGFYFTMRLDRYSCISLFFFDLQTTTTHLNVTSPPYLHCQFDFDCRSHMVTFYGPQVAQVWESSLNLTPMQHPHDEEFQLRERCVLILKLNPFEPGTIVFLRTLALW